MDSMKYSIQQIREMREKITPGEWTTHRQLYGILRVYSKNKDICESVDEDAVFIAAAPAIVDQLLERIKELEEKYEKGTT